MASILGPDGRPIPSSGAPAKKGWYGHDRRWEAADTNRLNKAHWAKADGQDINTDLMLRGHELRKRISYELANNGIVRGMCNTHKNDIVGPHGPTLNVIALDRNGNQVEAYAKAFEQIWREWWKRPDLNGELSGADWLRQNVEMLWQCGEYVAQFVTDRSRKGPVKTSVHPLHPRRIGSTMSGIAQTMRGKRDLIMGIERSKTGKALYYHVDDTPPGGYTVLTRAKRISAQNIHHRFHRDEPGQIRGVPWIASVLGPIADLRDYDWEELDAARLANYFSAVWETDHPDVDPITFDAPETTEMEPRTMKTGPPGWKVRQLQPHHPKGNYVEYRRERHRDIGRPVSMPAMISRFDSSRHNFSSARFDAQGYDRANEVEQAWIERDTMNVLAEKVRREATLEGELQEIGDKERVVRVEYAWSWGRKTHMAGDPQKEAGGAEKRMKNKLSTLADELAIYGKDLDAHLAQLAREAKKLKDRGLVQEEDSGGGGSIDRAVRDLFQRCIDEYAEQVGGEERPPDAPDEPAQVPPPRSNPVEAP